MSSGASAPIRLMNKQVNAYWGMVDKNTPQSAVYIHGQAHPPGFEGGLPTWVPIEFESVPAYESMDGILSLPDEFTLLCLLGYSSQAAGVAFQVVRRAPAAAGFPISWPRAGCSRESAAAR